MLENGFLLERVKLQTGIIVLWLLDQSWTICITTEGPLRAYKLFARVYSGKGDDLKISMYKMSIHIITKLKMVPQFNIMLQSSKHEGCYLIIDWVMPCVRPVENGHREGHPWVSPLSKHNVTIPSHSSSLLGLTINLWRHFLISILLLLYKETWGEEYEISSNQKKSKEGNK